MNRGEGLFIVFISLMVGMFLGGLIADQFVVEYKVQSRLHRMEKAHYTIPPERIELAGTYAPRVTRSAASLRCEAGTTRCTLIDNRAPHPDFWNVTCASPDPTSCRATLHYDERKLAGSGGELFAWLVYTAIVLFFGALIGIKIENNDKKGAIQKFFENACAGTAASYAGSEVVLRYSPKNGLTMQSADKSLVLMRHGTLVKTPCPDKWVNVEEKLRLPTLTDMTLLQIMRMRNRRHVWFQVVPGVVMMVTEEFVAVRIDDKPAVEFAFPKRPFVIESPNTASEGVPCAVVPPPAEAVSSVVEDVPAPIKPSPLK